MNWRRIPKETTTKPTIGRYSDWKTTLSEEGFHQCVYCTISENSFGGIRNFHVEHYKPKGLPQFAHLENDYANLFFSCSICNSFKSDDWPNEPRDDYSIDCYPDPSKKDYSELFKVVERTAIIEGLNIAGGYMENKLYLNRPQLIINRKENFVKEKYQTVIAEIKEQQKILFSLVRLGNPIAVDFLEKITLAIGDLESLFHNKEETIPYKSEQTKRKVEK